jgi:hypothetical protein
MEKYQNEQVFARYVPSLSRSFFMGITTSISISDADDSIGGTQIYPGYTSTITVAATVNDLTDDSRLSNPTISNEKLRLYDINGNLIATIDLVLTWTLVSSGDSNSNGFWDLGETLTWTASYTGLLYTSPSPRD